MFSFANSISKPSSTLVDHFVSILNSKWGGHSRDLLAVVGGFSILYHLTQLGIKYYRSRFQTLDGGDKSPTADGEQKQKLLARLNEKVSNLNEKVSKEKDEVISTVKSIGTWVKTNYSKMQSKPADQKSSESKAEKKSRRKQKKNSNEEKQEENNVESDSSL